ncbi:T9SS type B sorting domain-containing protein, partial [Flavobacterium aciduliphilum]
APIINTPTNYEVCDDNNDGISCLFLLNTKDSEVSTAPGIQITYHWTLTDAQTGSNDIPKNTPYCNINSINTQTLYIRVFDPAAPTCASITTLQLIVHPKPVANIPSDYHTCDDDTDGSAVFNLTAVVTPQVLGTTLPSATHTVTYYESLADAQAPTNPIAFPSAYLSSTKTLWIRVENTATGCFDITTVKLIVDPLPIKLAFYPQFETCEVNAPVGFETFDLTTQIPAILLGQTGVSVTFYPSLAEAVSNTNPITTPNAYTNAQANAQTIGIRLTNTSTGCFVVSTMDLIVNPKPQPIPQAHPYIVCDTDQDGVAGFDLNTLTPDILMGAPGVYTISYFLTQTDAINNVNPIDTSVLFYNNNHPLVQFIYVRAEDPTTHCFAVMQIELRVEPAPVAPANLPAIVNCDADANPQDGCTTFNLESQTPVILAAQALAGSNYTVTYYTSLANASASPNGLAPIVNTTNYTACGTTTIWVRVQNNTTGCFAVSQFSTQVNTPTVLSTPTLLKICDNDANPNDLYTTFNMSAFVGTVPGHTLEFFIDSAYTQPIANPQAFVNTIAATQTVFIVATNTTTGCKSYRTLTLVVLPVPTPNTNLSSMPLVSCDINNPNDGYEIFDLTTHATYIMNNDNNVTLHYYPSQNDAINNTNEILTPTAANVNQNVWIRVESNYFIDYHPEHCYVLVEQPIKVNPLPLLNSGIVYQECDDDTDGITAFDLTSLAAALLNGNALPLSNYTLAYYLTNPPTTPIANPAVFYNSNTTGNTQTIYVVATNTTTGCQSPVQSFTIMVNPKPTATAPTDFAHCDDEPNDNDGYYPYDLSLLIPTILGPSQTLADYDVFFYDSQYDPDATPPLTPAPITDLINYQTYTHTLWVVVKNKITGCERIVSFKTTIEQLPTPVITADTNVICVDYNTHQPVRNLVLTATNTTTYLSGTTPPTYTYQWLDAAGVPIAGATNQTYTVVGPFANNISDSFSVVMTSTTASPLGCSTTSAPFTVLQSGQAATVPAYSQGYTITNAFAENQIITVNVAGYGTYEFSLDDGPRQTSNVFENVALGTHNITVWDTEGGMQSSCDPLIISEVQTIDYPHFFTPNGDGINDYWNIVGLQNDFNAKIYIFDRYGKLIKQISPQSKGWDGTYNGNPMFSTDYWFSVDYSEANAIKQFKAHFSLKR